MPGIVIRQRSMIEGLSDDRATGVEGMFDKAFESSHPSGFDVSLLNTNSGASILHVMPKSDIEPKLQVKVSLRLHQCVIVSMCDCDVEGHVAQAMGIVEKIAHDGMVSTIHVMRCNHDEVLESLGYKLVHDERGGHRYEKSVVLQPAD